MKALTLWQPWASLVSLGVKSIETRSWSTDYRGPLAIHAARKRPASWTRLGDYRVKGFGRYGLALLGPGLPEFRSTPRLEGYQLPLGAVVATCTLTDVVPTEALGVSALPGWEGWHYQVNGAPTRHVTGPDTNPGPRRWPDLPVVMGLDQLPYGDFTPGRYAWLLDDVQPLDPPVAARGRQQLWEWPSQEQG